MNECEWAQSQGQGAGYVEESAHMSLWSDPVEEDSQESLVWASFWRWSGKMEKESKYIVYKI